MNRKSILAGFVGAIALASAAISASTAVNAAETLPATVAHQLDGQAVEFTMTAAKQRRLMIIEETQRQQRYGRRGYERGPGYGRELGYGYGPRRGYDGPPPGYRRYDRY
ncbi:hypothetical protein BHK69_24700 [Bosea vaviloviae]|uniref:Uncharacterized protein n=1 Tax=Bosea vaviloviae TaxID=1526658 RepID=A0A1D7U754_9HYPH|nr:hypothetical protein BHK69_24700 [Bosea vaviloviae]